MADTAAGAPALTMPEAEAEALRTAYAAAGVILEYGSGGSTVLAAGMAGKTVFSVENDPDWLARMEAWFRDNPPVSDLRLHRADTGPVGKWGMPKGTKAFRSWHGYPLSVWDRADFLHPDVVLVDGRFRVACLLVTAFRISRPVTVLFDDYGPRPDYHGVEALVKPAGRIGRMALFDLTPQPFPADRLGWFLPYLTRPA